MCLILHYISPQDESTSPDLTLSDKVPFHSSHNWMTWCVQLPPVCHCRYQCALCLHVLVVEFWRREVDLWRFSFVFTLVTLFSAAPWCCTLCPEIDICHLNIFMTRKRHTCIYNVHTNIHTHALKLKTLNLFLPHTRVCLHTRTGSAYCEL